MVGLSLTEERLEQRVGKHARIEGVLESVERFFTACMFEQRWHAADNSGARTWSRSRRSEEVR
jgi:hypothetical protein